MGNAQQTDPVIPDRSASFIRELICRFEEEVGVLQVDTVIEEAFFTVLVDGEPVRDMTCSPWDIPELVIGGLFTSGLIDEASQVKSLNVDEDAGLVQVSTVAPDAVKARRESPAMPVAGEGAVGSADEPMLSPRSVSSHIEFLEGNSHLFHRTGGVHSAAMVDHNGQMIAWFEDIGRHNALDKLAGWCLMSGTDTSDKVLLFSGRIPREIILRAIRMGFPMVISPGAPTNLSIDLACKHGITLIGFAKNGRFNVYTHPGRIAGANAS